MVNPFTLTVGAAHQAQGGKMLVLSRKIGERIVIGNDIIITIISIDRKGVVRLGIDAPPHIQVDRLEVHERRIKELKNIA